jgi:hypothetical protein
MLQLNPPYPYLNLLIEKVSNQAILLRLPTYSFNQQILFRKWARKNVGESGGMFV